MRAYWDLKGRLNDDTIYGRIDDKENNFYVEIHNGETNGKKPHVNVKVVYPDRVKIIRISLEENKYVRRNKMEINKLYYKELILVNDFMKANSGQEKYPTNWQYLCRLWNKRKKNRTKINCKLTTLPDYSVIEGDKK